MNQMATSKNPYQGATKKVLCVCSAGLLRSPTAAVVLSQEPFNYNTRAAGINDEYALIPVSEVLVFWADEIVCMEDWQAEELKKHTDKPVYCLNIEDKYEYRNPELIQLINDKYIEMTNEN